MSTAALARSPAPALDDRIASAFADGAKSSDVSELIVQVDAAARACNDDADKACATALDPSLPTSEVESARRLMEDAAFRQKRLAAASVRLRERLRELRDAEKDAVAKIARDKALAVRNDLVRELVDVYPDAAQRIADLLARVDASDRELARLGVHRGAELEARGLQSFQAGLTSVPRLVQDVHLPRFEDDPDRWLWPRTRVIYD